MPRKRITFIVIPPNDGQMQEYKFSSKLLWLGIGILLLTLSSLSYYAFDFHTRTDQAGRIAELMDENERMVRGLDLAHEDISYLELTMAKLVELDARLRAHHEMDPLPSAGVGGPEEPIDLPEDYTSLPARKRALLEDLTLKIGRLEREAQLQAVSFDSLMSHFYQNNENLLYIPAISPVPRDKTWKSSLFGPRTDPFTGKPARHMGIDFAGRTGIEIVATANGVVSYAYQDRRLGNAVVISHNPVVVDENGEQTSRAGMYRTEYGHLDKILVRKGQWVERGDVIGLMGTSGRSTAPHLHYAVRYQDRRRAPRTKGYINPADFLLNWLDDDNISGYLASAGEE
ncbi:MAG: M23 family metallopeptidase [Candidatus Latescibacteria bacterium]|nr:M23 family metallopeptidase [Candidatus Latescibacterota bacterium]